MPEAAGYDYWRAELAAPKSQSRDTSLPIWGFWRIENARTKPDTPFAAWGDESGTVYKIGRKDSILSTTEDAQRFFTFSFPHAIAVEESEYKNALVTGYWSDGKPSRQIEAVANERATEGQSNYAPVHEVIGERIELLMEKADACIPVDTKEKAEALAEIGQRLAAVVKEGEGFREKELAPLNEKVATINTQWASVQQAAGRLPGLRHSLRAWLKSEEDRLAKEARLAEEARKSSPAEGSGATETEGGVAPTPPPKVKVAPAYGRATVLRKVVRGVIIDRAKFLRSVKDDDDVTELLQRKANALARAGTKKPGMTIEESRE